MLTSSFCLLQIVEISFVKTLLGPQSPLKSGELLCALKSDQN